MENAWKHPEWIAHSSDDPIIETHWISYLLGRDGANDEPSPEAREGLACLARLEDLLKDSAAVKIDRLCLGESKKAKEFTKKEIQRIIEKFSSQGTLGESK